MIEERQEQCIADNRRVLHPVGDAELIICADRNRLEQVISNLLTNAVKGIGIPEDKINDTFDRFYRVENASKNFLALALTYIFSSGIIKRLQDRLA